MKMFLTKVWGFSEPCGPLQFSTDGWRDRAREKLNDGDRVILVGTKGEKTDEDDQGRILGMMEPTKEVVSSLDFSIPISDEDYTKEGNYKWPYALLNKRAWIFEDDPRPLLRDITSRRFNMDSASGIVPLEPEEMQKVLNLKHREIDLLKSVRTENRILGRNNRRRGAPPPTTTRRGVMHMRDAEAQTYLMEIEGNSRTAYKVGWAFDHDLRQRQFNLYSMPSLGGLRYTPILFHDWDTAREAYRMEQYILKEFDENRHSENCEILTNVTRDQLYRVWENYLVSTSRKKVVA